MQEQECCAAEARAWSSQAQQGAGAGPQPTLRPCHAQSLALWFRLERVKHIRSNCLLRRQKSALTSNIEAPRDTTEEFPLAGVCGKPYIKCQGQPVCFPHASDWESSSTFLAFQGRSTDQVVPLWRKGKQIFPFVLLHSWQLQQWQNHPGETLT